MSSEKFNQHNNSCCDQNNREKAYSFGNAKTQHNRKTADFGAGYQCLHGTFLTEILYAFLVILILVTRFW